MEPIEIQYGTAGGEALVLDAYPAADARAASVIVIHGGGWASGDKRADLPFIPALVSAGLHVFSVNYRLAPRHPWPACYEDVAAAVAWVKERAHAENGDESRLGVVGYSAGGHLAAMAAVRIAGVKAAGLLAAPTDMVIDNFRRGGLSASMVGLLRGTPPATRKGAPPEKPTPEELEMLWQFSPINELTPRCPPCYCVHGTADQSVPFMLAKHWKQRCDQFGIPCEVVPLEGKPHRISEWAGYEAGLAAWLAKTL